MQDLAQAQEQHHALATVQNHGQLTAHNTVLPVQLIKCGTLEGPERGTTASAIAHAQVRHVTQVCSALRLHRKTNLHKHQAKLHTQACLNHIVVYFYED